MDLLLTRYRLEGRVSWNMERRMAVPGQLFLAEVREQNRSVKVATFRRSDKDPAEIPPLRDAMLLGIGPDWLTLTGIELDAGSDPQNPRAYGQTWRLTTVDESEVRRLWGLIARLNKRLGELGVTVEVRTDLSLVIPGETPFEEPSIPGRRRPRRSR